jgi:ubiquinone/menaquinone biosynthesis C-methylase UbiE
VVNISEENDTMPEIEDIDWNSMWNKALNKMPKKDAEKMWNKIAPKFDQWMKTDNYPQELAARIHKEPTFTVLDLGCGNGSITLELAQKVKKITAVDMSHEMLSLVNKKALDENISNINYLQSTIEDLEIESIGQHDVVVSSRSLGGVHDLKKELKKIDELARKYVYITLWSATANQFDKEVAEFMDIEYHQHPDYIYALNMLYQMGIYANVEMLENQTPPVYCNLEDAMERCLWKIGWNADEIKKEDKIKLEKFLRKNLNEKDNETLNHPTNNPRWVLLWWKKRV